MLGINFRPWGNIEWVTKRLSAHPWSILGCLSPADRCLAILSYIKTKGLLGHFAFLQIKDPPSRYTAITDEILKKRHDEFRALTGGVQPPENHELFEEIYKLVDSVNTFINKSGGNVIVDISSFPKRYFFPIVKVLLKSTDVKNLIATYTVPEKYSDEPLAEDPEPWIHIPMFGPTGYPENSINSVVVGVGFMPFGLPELLKNNFSNRAINVKFLFPFPPGPPTYQRTWDFVREIEKDFVVKPNQLQRVDTYDVSDIFDYISSITQPFFKKTILAPYGPKSISLAMCIFASLTETPVYYTQPKVYNPGYCTGIKMNLQGVPESYAYCLRLNGKDCYNL